MKRFVWLIVCLLAICMMVEGTAVAGGVEIVDKLDEPMTKAIYTYAVEKAVAMGEILKNERLTNDMLEFEYIDQNGYDLLTQMDYSQPYSAGIMITNENFDVKNFWIQAYGEQSVTDEVALSLKAGLCFHQMYRTNAYKGSHDFANMANCMSIFDVTQIEGFKNIAFVLLAYTPEIPYIVTAYCDMGDGIVITKTEMVYLTPVEEYGNEFMRFSGLIWGVDSIDTLIYKPKKDD